MMNKILKIDEAIKYLKDNICIFSYSNKELNLFKKVENNILIKNNKSSFYLKIEEFYSLYKNESFGIYNREDSELIDKEKDDEYYKMSGLKH